MGSDCAAAPFNFQPLPDVLSIVLVIATLWGVGAGLATMGGGVGKQPNMPASAPSNLTFAIVWPILYAALGFAIWLVGRRIVDPQCQPVAIAALALLAVGVALNWAWAPTFNSEKPREALYVLLGALAATAGAAMLVASMEPAASALLGVYIAWLIFALVLNNEVVVKKGVEGAKYVSAASK